MTGKNSDDTGNGTVAKLGFAAGEFWILMWPQERWQFSEDESATQYMSDSGRRLMILNSEAHYNTNLVLESTLQETSVLCLSMAWW